MAIYELEATRDVEPHLMRSAYCIAVVPGGVVIGGNHATLGVYYRTGARSRILAGHTGVVRCVTALPDGRAASGANDHVVKLWDLAHATCVQTLAGHDHAVVSVEALPEGRLASGGVDCALLIWDLAEGRCNRSLVDSGFVYSVLALPGERLASGTSEKTINIWDVAARERDARIHTLSGHDGWVYCVAALERNDDAERIVSGSADCSIKIWDLTSLTCVLTINEHAADIRSVAVAGGRMFSGSLDGTVKVFNAADGRCIETLTGPSGQFTCVNVLPCGRIITGSADDTHAKIWVDARRQDEKRTATLVARQRACAESNSSSLNISRGS